MPRSLFPLLLAVWMACVAAAGAAVVRCTAPDGHITYQDSSCPRGSRATPVDEMSNAGVRFADEKQVQRLRKQRAAERAAAEKRAAGEARASGRDRVSSSRAGEAGRKRAEAAAASAAERKYITAGTAIEDVRARIGAPDHITRLASGTARPSGRQRWVYLPAPDDPQTTTVLSVHSGVVTNVDRRIVR